MRDVSYSRIKVKQVLLVTLCHVIECCASSPAFENPTSFFHTKANSV